MSSKCFDIGTIQAFLDGELAAEQTESVARHVSACDDCALRLADAEEETAVAFTALEQEFNTLVPTQRLWTKISDSIAREKKPFWKPILAFLLKPQTAALASLLFVGVVSITLLSLKPDAPTNFAVQKSVNKQTIAQTVSDVSPIIENQPSPVIAVPQISSQERTVETVSFRQNKNEARKVKISSVVSKDSQKVVQPSFDISPVETAAAENVSGEESYVKTIATLTETVNARKDEILDSSARFSFERDLAVTDDAIARMKKEVRRDPKNEAAKDILRASYQNKIDLLNSMADKTDLMASLK